MTFVSAGRRSVLLMVAAMSALVMVLPSGLRSATAQTSTGTSSLTMVRQTPFVGPTGTFRIELATRGLPAGARIALTV